MAVEKITSGSNSDRISVELSEERRTGMSFQRCVRHLMGEALSSGWGARTMASTEDSYNPIRHRVGTVWPHDNSLIVWGLRRYGCRVETAELFHHRLPEAFGGYSRRITRYPVEYPTAFSPQAWATATPLLLLRVLLGLDSDRRHLIIDLAIPVPIKRLELLDIVGCWGTMDAFGRGRVKEVTWFPGTGL